MLLITSSSDGRTFDYGDEWKGGDLISAGQGLTGDQRSTRRPSPSQRPRRERDASSFKTRRFDPDRKPAERRRRSAPKDPERQLVLAEQADNLHQKTLKDFLAQLLEYRLFLGEEKDGLCLGTSRPILDRRLWLLDSLGIGHAYVEDGEVTISGTSASRALFGR